MKKEISDRNLSERKQNGLSNKDIENDQIKSEHAYLDLGKYNDKDNEDM
jgi:hypothetical protein